MYPSISSPAKTYGSHLIDEEDINAVIEVLQGPSLTGGKFVTQFEENLAKVSNSAFAVACSNGTTALHLASVAAKIKPEENVIVPAITFLATANAPRYCGANVIFCDVDPESGLVTEETLTAAIKRSPQNPVAFYPVDLAGQPSLSASMKRICKSNDIKIIQDSCHSLGTTFLGEEGQQIVGSNQYADFTVFSFHPVKNITTGEGGAITTNCESAYLKMKTLRSHGMLREGSSFLNRDLAFDAHGNQNPWYYEMQQIGFNYRITDIQAALGISQLKKLETFKQTQKRLKSLYDEALKPYAPFIRPLKAGPNSDPCWHLYIAMIDFTKVKKTRAEVMTLLAEKEIGTQVHYIPVHLQPYYQKHSSTPYLEGAENYYAKALSLPFHVFLREEDVHKVVGVLTEILGLK